MQTPILIRQARVLTLDSADKEYTSADILISEGKITAIDTDLPIPDAALVIEAKGLLAMPGLVNSHFHSPGSFLKGQLPSLPLELFMLYEVPPTTASRDVQRYRYLCTQVAALEMLERGITSVHDDAYHIPSVSEDSIDAIMMAYDDSGIRATVAIDQANVIEYEKLPYLYDLLPVSLREEMRDAPIETAESLLAHYRYLFDNWHGKADGRLSAALSCSAPQRVTTDYLHALNALSKHYNAPLNLHVLETRLQREFSEQRYGKSLVRYVEDLDVLNERCQVIHAIWIDEEDVAALAKSGCTVAHNPVCNLRLGSGIMPYRALKEAGVPIALGTDELCSDDSANLWQVGKMAGLIHNITDADFDRWPQPEEILSSLTRGGARALHKSGDLGELSVGAIADVILLDLDRWSFNPLNNLKRQLIYCEDGSSVRHTIVNGLLVYSEGEFANVDARAVREEIRSLGPIISELNTATESFARKMWPYYKKMYESSRKGSVHPTLNRF